MCIYYLSADMAGDLGVEGKWEGKIGKIFVEKKKRQKFRKKDRGFKFL